MATQYPQGAIPSTSLFINDDASLPEILPANNAGIVSNGGLTLAVGTLKLCNDISDILNIANGSQINSVNHYIKPITTTFCSNVLFQNSTIAFTSIQIASNVATLTTTAAHNLPLNSIIAINISTGTYAGTYAATVASATTLTFPFTASNTTDNTDGSFTIVSNGVTHVAISTLAVSSGIASVTCSAAHGLPAGQSMYVMIIGCSNADYNGLKRVTTNVSNGAVLTFQSNDYGDAVDGYISYFHCDYAGGSTTVNTNLTLPIGIYKLTLANVTNLPYENGYVFAYATATTNPRHLIIPFDYTKTAPVVTNTSVIRFFKCVSTGHSLPLDSTAPVDNISFVYLLSTDSNYATNGGSVQYVTATDDNTFYFGTGKVGNITNITGNNSISFVKVVLDTTLATEFLETVFNGILLNTGNAGLDNVLIGFIMTSATVLTGAVAWGTNHGSATNGVLLDQQAQQLTLAFNSFFNERTGRNSINYLPVNILEIGSDTVANEVDYFYNYLTSNSNYLKVTRWLLPIEWDLGATGYFKKVLEYFNPNDYDIQFILPTTTANAALYQSYRNLTPFVADPSTSNYYLKENPAGALLFKLVNRFIDLTRYNMPVDESYINAQYGDLTPFDITDYNTTVPAINDAKITVVSYSADKSTYKFFGGLTSDSFKQRLVDGRLQTVDCEVTTIMGVHQAKQLVLNAFNYRIEQSKNEPDKLLLINNPTQVMASVKTLLAVIDSALKDAATKNLIAYQAPTILSYQDFVKLYGAVTSSDLGGFFNITLQKADFVLRVKLLANQTY
jgi:hypothetical protein